MKTLTIYPLSFEELMEMSQGIENEQDISVERENQKSDNIINISEYAKDGRKKSGGKHTEILCREQKDTQDIQITKIVTHKEPDDIITTVEYVTVNQVREGDGMHAGSADGEDMRTETRTVVTEEEELVTTTETKVIRISEETTETENRVRYVGVNGQTICDGLLDDDSSDDRAGFRKEVIPVVREEITEEKPYRQLFDRRALEEALREKMHHLANKVKQGKIREQEYITKINETNKATEAEEVIVMELHEKLKLLDETLRAKEKENSMLERQILDADVDMCCHLNSWEREHVFVSETVSRGGVVRLESGEVVTNINVLLQRIKDLDKEIQLVEKNTIQEEYLLDDAQSRVTALTFELDSVRETIARLETRYNVVTERHSKLLIRIEEISSTRESLERNNDALEKQVWQLKSILDGLIEKLAAATELYRNLQHELVMCLARGGEEKGQEWNKLASNRFGLPKLRDYHIS